MKKPEIKDAGVEYAEIWGEAIHSNRHLRVISVGLAIGVLLLIGSAKPQAEGRERAEAFCDRNDDPKCLVIHVVLFRGHLHVHVTFETRSEIHLGPPARSSRCSTPS